ncbi:hypothetical protein KSF73_05670 [Burkholderiaceae bacterium DAT-1]|nr:hypothetical protein [Burkholderiaceae bacterium DAT-1]
MSDHEAFYAQLSDRILRLWNTAHEHEAEQSLARAWQTANGEGREQRQRLFKALMDKRVHRSSTEVIAWLDMVLKQFGLPEELLPETYQNALSYFVSLHLDHFTAFEARGTIARIKQKINFSAYSPEWGALDWRRLDDETIRAGMAVLNVFNEDGLKQIIEHLDAIDSERTRTDLENGLATPANWDRIDPAQLPQDKTIEGITEAALNRMIAASATLNTSPANMAPQAAESPERFSLFTRLAALTWMMDLDAFKKARDTLDPQIFWPAMAAALRLRRDSPILNEIMLEIGRSGAGPLMLKNCDPRTAYNYSKEVRIVAPPGDRPAPSSTAPSKDKSPHLPSKPLAGEIKRR